MSTVESVGSTPGLAIEPLDGQSSVVRFESQCVVIPDQPHHSRRPRVFTKSYALPLWKRRAVSAGPASPDDTQFEENQSNLVLRVPILSLKPPRSTRPTADPLPLPPCLVQHPRTSDPTSPTSPPRRARSQQRSVSPSRPDIITLPLRPCCAECQPVTEAAYVDGDAWPIHFSRSALKLRQKLEGPRTITVAGSAASAAYGDLGVSINVDEVDKRRRLSVNLTDAVLPSDSLEGWKNFECGVPSIVRSVSSASCSADGHCQSPSPSRMAPGIPEEDDDEDERELFPLPSPRRTPSSSPAPSSTGSSIYYTCTGSPTPSSCSGESIGPQRNTLAPPPCSSSALSLPRYLTDYIQDLSLNMNKDLPRVPSPSRLSALPPISARSRSLSPRSAFVPPTPSSDGQASASDSTPPKTPQSPAVSPIPIKIPTFPARYSGSSTSPHASASSTLPHQSSSSHGRIPWRFKRSASAESTVSPSSSFSPSTSPPSVSVSPKPSTSTPRYGFSDMLRSVGAMGSGGMSGMM